MTLTLRIVLAVLLAAGGSSARAQADYPTKPIRMIVPLAAASAVDNAARIVAQRMAESLGQPIVIENQPGASGLIGADRVAKAAPDGYTIILGHVGSLAVHPYIFNNLQYDVNKDFIPVTMLARVPNMFVIHPDLPAKNFKEFVELVKKNPGKYDYGSAGNASAGHLAMEYLKMVTGMFMTHIPYRGTGPQLTDLLAGRTHACSAGLPALIPHVKSGKLRAIAVGTAQRLPMLPDVPTVAEMGFKDFETSQWYGILVPAGTPRDIVKRLQEESLKAMKSNSVTARFTNDGAFGGGSTPEEFAAFIANQQKVWSLIIKRAGIKPD